MMAVEVASSPRRLGGVGQAAQVVLFQNHRNLFSLPRRALQVEGLRRARRAHFAHFCAAAIATLQGQPRRSRSRCSPVPPLRDTHLALTLAGIALVLYLNSIVKVVPIESRIPAMHRAFHHTASHPGPVVPLEVSCAKELIPGGSRANRK